MKLNVQIFITFLTILLGINITEGKTIEVCSGCPVQNLLDASKSVQPGDTILLRAGVYTTSSFISNLQGKSDNWITITAPKNEEVIFRGQSTAMQLSDPSYLRIENLIFEGQAANGVNIDDGGSYNTPAHNIVIENCEWRSINATGNNDMLKMSGVDNFRIVNCKFSNGSPGGSGIDMVGCHNGVIEKCVFENQGSNSIQNKGGTSQITIQKNLFINGGLRALNIGGSTGLEFFRPLGVKYEAKEIFVYSNIFIGSQAPIAFVGSINCKVVNNTIYLPTKWAIRILQENTNEGFVKCGNNSFINNIVYVGNNAANPTINIGSNTEPNTFVFSNNLWFNKDNLNWTGPNLPVSETNSYKNINPLIIEINSKLIQIDKSSPAKGKGLDIEMPKEDFEGNLFSSPRSIGAIEINPKINSAKFTDYVPIIFPNPACNYIEIKNYEGLNGNSLTKCYIYNALGDCVMIIDNKEHNLTKKIEVQDLPNGSYFIILGNKFEKFLIER